MKISRRDALIGATAAAVVTGAATAPLTMKAPGVKAALADDPVIPLARQLRAATEAWSSSIDAFEDDANRVGFDECYYDGLVQVDASDGRCTWVASEIREAAEAGRDYDRLTPDQRDAALAEIERRQREGREVRRELGLEPLWQEVEHWKTRFWDLHARVLDTPAATPRGILAKLRGFYHADEIADMRAGGAIIFAASTYIAIRESRLARAKRARGGSG